MRFRSIVLAASAASAVLAVLSPGMALAQSTTVYPAGDTLTTSSTPVTFKGVLFAEDKCTMNSFTLKVPEGTGNHNASGPVTVFTTTKPTFSSCSGYPVSTAGAGQWWLNLQYGGLTAPSSSFNIPASGIEFNNSEFLKNNELSSNTAAWANGFSSPVSVSSSFSAKFEIKVNQSAKEPFATSEPFLVTVTDTTHPTSIPVVGP